jgi:hypothetical protein
MQAGNTDNKIKRDNKLKSKFFVIISKVEFYISSEKIMLNVEIDKFKLL